MRHIRFEVRHTKPPHPLMGWLDLSVAAVVCLLANDKVELPLCVDEKFAKESRQPNRYSIPAAYFGLQTKRIQLHLTTFNWVIETPFSYSQSSPYLEAPYEVFFTESIDLLVRLPGYVRNPNYVAPPCEACGGSGIRYSNGFMDCTSAGPCAVCKGTKVQP